MRITSVVQEGFQFSDYQMAQLNYFWKSTINEVSKIVIMAFFFHKELPLYFFTLLLMAFLRTASSGIHLRHYLSCFAFSFAYVFSLLRILNHIVPDKLIQLPCLLACIAVIYLIGPLPSKKHKKLEASVLKKLRLRGAVIAAIYSLFCLLTPASIYTTIGFWVVVLHTLQLTIAKLLQKGGKQK